MKNLRVLIPILLSVLAGCSSQSPQTNAQAEAITLSVTKWSGKTELFMEYPPLVAGKTGRFAVHFTNLSDFKAVTGGRVTVELQGGGSPDRFAADPQKGPGIFGVNVTPQKAGIYSMTVKLESPAVSDSVLVGDVTALKEDV